MIPFRHLSKYWQRCGYVKSLSFSIESLGFQKHAEVVTEEEEKLIISHIDNLFRRKRYEVNHWDGVITKYREIELQADILIDTYILRLQKIVIDGVGQHLTFLQPHALDLHSDGFISSV